MPDNKIITLENLTEFKAKCDETYSGGGTKLYRHELFCIGNGPGAYINFYSVSGTAITLDNCWQELSYSLYISADGTSYYFIDKSGSKGDASAAVHYLENAGGAIKTYSGGMEVTISTITDTITEL